MQVDGDDEYAGNGTISDSSSSSFVLVDNQHDHHHHHEHHHHEDHEPSTAMDPTLLAKLSPYFQSIADPLQHNEIWSYDRTQELTRARQARPDSKLFIDELFSLVQLDGPSIYPPTSAESFNKTLYQLLTSTATLQAHCILFYLVLADNHHNQSISSTLTTAFCRDFLLPAGFVRSVEGFHALDQGHFKAAVSALTDPHLTPDFVAKTFALLGSNLPDRSQRASLVLSFWRLSNVPLDTVQEVTVVLRALCDQQRKFGVTEAWSLHRKWQNDQERKQLLHCILASCFGDNPFSKPVPHHLQTLLVQPFTRDEDILSNEFCSAAANLPGVNLNLAVDWRLSKYIAESRPLDALRFWSTVKAIVPASDDRDRLLKAVYATLTEVQRSMIALETEDLVPKQINGGSKSTPFNPSAQSVDVTRPAWQGTAAPPAAGPPPRSLYGLQVSRQVPPASPAPTASELPLSASPFLRRERPLVSTTDGTALGGVQKNVLRALKEGGIGPVSPHKTQLSKVMSSSQQQSTSHKARSESPFVVPGSPGASSVAFGSPRVLFPTSLQHMTPGPAEQQQGPGGQSTAADAPGGGMTPKKPTLSGFGSVRQPFASTMYGRAPAVNVSSSNDVDMEAMEEAERQDQDDDQFFAVRAAHDPAIKATIAAAAAGSGHSPRAGQHRAIGTGSPSTSTATGKRRGRSSNGPDAGGDSAGLGSTGRGSESAGAPKRRAISVEPAEDGARDRPTPLATRKATVGAGPSKGALPPGAFPGQEEEHDDDEDDDNEASGHDGREARRTNTSASQRRTTRPRTRTAIANGSNQISGGGGRTSSKVNPGSERKTSNKTPARKRSTRASSVQPSDDPEDESGHDTRRDESAAQRGGTAETPRIRRSSRLRTPAAKDARQAQAAAEGGGGGGGRAGTDRKSSQNGRTGSVSRRKKAGSSTQTRTAIEEEDGEGGESE